ncbi:MAG: apolipoprotein N-acyltransferase [Desulfobacter sp.]|nr:MAG: apolipoprotein N-acyltransferase [Desulfobacter sp.]
MNPISRLSILLPYFPALVSGMLLTLAFPDHALYPVAFFALVPLWTSMASMGPRQAFSAGMVTGVSHFLTLIYWIVPCLTRFGNLNIGLSLACLVLLSLYLALYTGGFAYILNKLAPRPWLAPFWGGTVWVGLEFIRSHALTGFPWGVLGYTQSPNIGLVQMADLTGVLGISFVLLLSNGILAQAWLALGPQNRIKSIVQEQRGAWIFSLVLGIFLVAGAHAYGFFRLPHVQTWIKSAPHTKISVVQGNIEQDQKWDKAFKDFTLDRYTSLSLKACPADLIVWPETALPFYYGRDPVYSSRVDQLIRQTRTHFLLGSPAVDSQKESISYYNRAYMLNPLSMVTGTYDKTHLVPFGEYVPFQNLFWFVKKLTQAAGNFSQGRTGAVPLNFKPHKTGVLICFEILFPDISRAFVQNGADILTTITNDAWFGQTSAPAQHFSFGVLRAVENRRSLVRAANTGISGFIDPSGKILLATQLFVPAAATQDLPALSNITFYTRHGDLIGIFALVAMAMGFMIKPIKNKFRRLGQ